MKTLSHLDAIAFADLLDLCREDVIDPPFKANGSFMKQARNGTGEYWYYRGYEKPLDGSPGKATLKYAGKVGDPEIERIVAAHAARHASHRKRRELASHLRRAGLPVPQPMEGAVTAVLAEHGLFVAGSVMVGSVAFQTFGGPLGVKIEEGAYRTQDVDVAQPTRLQIDPKIPAADILVALRGADPSFVPFFLRDEPRLIAGYRNNDNFKLEFLTPQKSERRSNSPMSEVAGLQGVGALRLKYLEFVLADPTDSVMLHDAGIRVCVPDPMRYAVHKLIVSVQRASSDAPARSNAKALKDVVQAEALIEASVHARTAGSLGSVWVEAWNHGPKWRKNLREGTLKLAPAQLAILADHAAEAAAMEGKDCPFEGGDPRKELVGMAAARVTGLGAAMPQQKAKQTGRDRG